MKICSIAECGRKHYVREWCVLHYTRWRRHGNPLSGNARYNTPEEAFEARTMPVTETGCLIWTGNLNDTGYGQIWVNKRLISTHIFAWEKIHGSVPQGYMLDHKCHTPSCCNPIHLRLATRSQNNSNLSKLKKNNASGHRNVSWHEPTQKWRVRVESKYFGLFTNLEEAARVAEEARQELFGEFAGMG